MLLTLFTLGSLLQHVDSLALASQGLSAMPLPSPSSVSQSSSIVTPTPVPSIIPDWHGLRTPNYTDLHIQFTVPLQCGALAVPTGVLGFYSYLLSLIMLYCAFKSNADEARGHCRRALSHLLTMIFFGIMLGLRIAGSSVCNRQTPESAQRTKHWDKYEGRWADDTYTSDGYKIGWFVITSLSAGAGFHCMIDIEHGMKTLLLVTTVAVGVPGLLYNSYANFLYIDGSLWKQILAVSLPLAALLAGFFYLMVNKIRKMDFEDLKTLRSWKRMKVGFLIMAVVSGVGLVFHLWAVGISIVLLGRTISDPWGFRTARNNFGQVMLALQGVLVPAALYNALF